MITPVILITNDDGIKSPGLLAAVESVIGLGDIYIVAPSKQQTSMGRSLWGGPDERFQPIDYEANGHSIPAYHAHCAPAQLIVHAQKTLFNNRKIDLLISGVNYGENLGTNIGISATCGGALQAASDGIPALAISLETEVENHFLHAELEWSASRYFTRLFAEKMLAAPLPHDVDVINVNIPTNATPETPWEITRQSRLPYYALKIDTPTNDSKMGDRIVVVEFDDSKLESDSDINAISNKHIVSVTPLSIDSTSRVDLKQLF
jgi:5'-nucleotidase